MILQCLVKVEFTQQFFPSVGMAVVTALYPVFTALYPVFTKILEMLNMREAPTPAATYGWY